MYPNGEQTTVHENDVDLTQWLNAPTGANVVTPTGDNTGVPNANFFKRSNDLSFLNQSQPAPDKTKEPVTGNENPATTPAGQEPQGTPPAEPVLSAEEALELENIIKPGSTEAEETETGDTTPAGAGRPKSERSLLLSYLKAKIEAGEMMAYEDWDESKMPIDEYLNGFADKDLNELLDTNISNLKEGTQAAYRQEFFNALPKDLQYAYRMYENGATDLKPVWAALSQVAQVRDLDPSKDADQPEIVRQFLHATGFGTAEEIEAEIEMYSNNAVIANKAKQFKPKLDSMSQQLVEQQVKQQEDFNRRQQAAAKAYREMAFKALEPGKLHEVKIDRKTQEALYNGLTRSQFPSITGDQTNELGYLLEKYQFVEPNLALISEALWLLRDPEGYRKELMTVGANTKVEQQVRKLKTEQNRKVSGASQQNFETEDNRPKKLPKVNPNFFKR